MRIRLSSLFGFVLVLAACISFAQNQVSDKAVQRIQKEVRHELLIAPVFRGFSTISPTSRMVTSDFDGQVTRPTLRATPRESSGD